MKKTLYVTILTLICGVCLAAKPSQPVFITDPTGAFGEISVASPTPVLQVLFPYVVNDRQMLTLNYSSATNSWGDGMMIVSAAAGTNTAAYASTKDVLRYHPGQGGLVRFTALFSLGATGSTLWAGVGDVADGLFFGYKGPDFGIMRRENGSQEVQILVVSTKSTDAENIQITLNGVDVTDVAVTDQTAGTVEDTAFEIAAHDYSDVDDGWTATHLGDTVIFRSFNANERTLAFNLSSGVATTARGTFSESINGAAPTETFTAQADWNIANLTGNSDNSHNITPALGNVYQIRYQWLGYGAVKFYIEDPFTGVFDLVHIIRYANTATVPVIRNPTLPVHFEAANTTNNTAIVVKTASVAAFIEGVVSDNGLRGGVNVDGSASVASTTSEVPVVSLRVKDVFQGRTNRATVSVSDIEVTVDMTGISTLRFYVGGTLTAPLFADFLTTSSVVETDSAATAFSPTGAVLLHTVSLKKEDTFDLNIGNEFGILHPGDILTVTVEPDKSHADNQAFVSINWKDNF